MAYGDTAPGDRAACAPASLPEALQPELIELAHERSMRCGLDPSDMPDFSRVAPATLAEAVEQHRQLYVHALPVMETLYEQIRNTQNMVLLTNGDGLILHALGDDDFLEKADKVALTPGVTWSEASKGTNAIGTALIENRPTVVNATQHYLRVNHFLTCSCAPILDPQGNLIGALDVTGEERAHHRHTLALARMSALMIENHVLAAAFPEGVRIRFHARPEFIGTLMEGIVAFTPGGRFLAANRSAQFQLGLSLAALRTHSFASLFGMAMSALFDHYRASNPQRIVAALHSGVAVHLQAEFKAPSAVFGPATWGGASRQPDGLAAPHDAAPPVPAGPAAKRRAAPGWSAAGRSARAVACASAGARPGLSSLRYLDTGDARIAALIAKLDKVLGRDVPILLLGETGTGKELLARAIHQDSPRRDGPFVAVDCASIPETLIEAELFGHAEGAFTGARKAGSPGKLAQAHGGTLFLDEIGDMPYALQTRLLRVLQERVVSPLGGGRPVSVDFSVICATHRNLRDSIAANRFREDLYYRINGLVLRLPALRERTDLDVIVRRILDAEHDEPLEVDPQVMALFRRHGWPGNLRQLTGLLRTAGLMAAGEGVIRAEHLPEDFLPDDLAPHEPHEPHEPAPGWAGGTLPEPDRSAGPTGAPAGAQRLQDVQRSAIAAALDQHGGNVSAAAKALGVSRNTIYRRLGGKPADDPA